MLPKKILNQSSEATMLRHVFFSLLILFLLHSQSAIADDVLCNGRGKQGELLFSPKFIMRTGLCNEYDESKGLLITQDAINRLTWDYYNNLELFKEIKQESFAAMYRDAFVTSMRYLMKSGKIKAKVTAASGVEPAPTLNGKGEPQEDKGNKDEICEPKDKRCIITNSGKIKVISIQLLQEMLAIKAAAARNKAMGLMFEKIIPANQINAGDEQLKYPKGYESVEREKKNE